MRVVATLERPIGDEEEAPFRLAEPLKAEAAIVLYQGRSLDGAPITLAAKHDVVATEGEKGRPILGAGSPMDKRTIDLMFRQIVGQKEASKGREMIPAELLFADEGRMVWFRPARRHPIFFRTGKSEFDKEMNTQEVLWPNLLFCADRGSLRMWALAEETRPTPETPLYLAPLYNFNSTGAMCAGNVQLPNMIDPSIKGRTKWEEAVYSTEFTHTNYHGVKYTNHPLGHDGLWREMRKRTSRQGFPVAYLVDALKATGEANAPRRTVGEVIAG